MTKLQPNQNPVFQHGSKFVLALFEVPAKGCNTVKAWDLPCKRAIFEFVVSCQFERGLDIRC